MSRSNRDQAMDLYSELSETLSAESILDFLILNYLTGSDALEAMQAVEVEFYGEEEEEEEELEVGMEVEVIDGSNSRNEVGDIGIITEVGLDNDPIVRVTVEGRTNSGNWMFHSQVARINY
jgi:hypothetical protein